ncbi:hypothetical protein V3C99_002527, partial [Haemonchus contortus]
FDLPRNAIVAVHRSK